MNKLTQVILFLSLQLKGTKEYLGVYIFQSLFIPIVITLLIFFSGESRTSLTFIYFLFFTLSSVIPTLGQQISNDLLPDIKDLNASTFVSMDTLFYGRLTLPFIFLSPQIIIISVILRDVNILIASIILYLFLSSVGIAIGSTFKMPMTANMIGTMLYLICIGTAPLYFTESPLSYAPFSLLICLNPIVLTYTLGLTAVFMLYSYRKMM